MQPGRAKRGAFDERRCGKELAAGIGPLATARRSDRPCELHERDRPARRRSRHRDPSGSRPVPGLERNPRRDRRQAEPALVGKSALAGDAARVSRQAPADPCRLGVAPLLQGRVDEGIEGPQFLGRRAAEPGGVGRTGAGLGRLRPVTGTDPGSDRCIERIRRLPEGGPGQAGGIQGLDVPHAIVDGEQGVVHQAWMRRHAGARQQGAGLAPPAGHRGRVDAGLELRRRGEGGGLDVGRVVVAQRAHRVGVPRHRSGLVRRRIEQQAHRVDQAPLAPIAPARQVGGRDGAPASLQRLRIPPLDPSAPLRHGRAPLADRAIDVRVDHLPEHLGGFAVGELVQEDDAAVDHPADGATAGVGEAEIPGRRCRIAMLVLAGAHARRHHEQHDRGGSNQAHRGGAGPSSMPTGPSRTEGRRRETRQFLAAIRVAAQS